MDLWAFYDAVDAFTGDLRASGETVDADRIERAKASGATSGEILGDLSLAFEGLTTDDAELRRRGTDLQSWATAALR